MAEKRMISKVISISKKFNLSLNDHFSRLLYILLIPHSDDFGRLTGDPFKIKALILPMMNDVTWEEVEKSLSKLHNAELIIWYESTGEMFIQIINFDNHQQGLHKRTRSKFPEPPTVSRKFPEIPLEGKGTELNRTEEKGTEGKGTEGKGTEGKGEEQKGEVIPLSMPSTNPHETHVLKLINENNVTIDKEYPKEQFFSYIGAVDLEVIEVAIKKSNGKKISYCLGTLEGMIKDGISKKEHLPKVKVGDFNEKHQGEREFGRDTSSTSKGKTEAIGWLPSAAKPANFTEMHKVSGQ